MMTIAKSSCCKQTVGRRRGKASYPMFAPICMMEDLHREDLTHGFRIFEY
jgi:hypothetical protein